MLSDPNIPELVDRVDMSSLRVHPPTSILFVCGGPTDITSQQPLSLRDAFAKLIHLDPFKKYSMLLAEELNAFFPKGKYTDILTFEAHIAQISELIVLFSESYGSAAELGAFAILVDTAHRLLVVIDDEHYNANSFISLGPVRALENEYGNGAVCVLNRGDLKIPNIRNVRTLDVETFKDSMKRAIKTRQASSRERTSFDPSRPGHIIKFIVGLIQHYGSLTLAEVDAHLYAFNLKIEEETLLNYLLCAEFAEWIIKDKRGIETYFTALPRNKAIQYELLQKKPMIDKTRWQADIVEHWKSTDPDRFSSIQNAMSK